MTSIKITVLQYQQQCKNFGVRKGPGIGFEVNREKLEQLTVEKESITTAETPHPIP